MRQEHDGCLGDHRRAPRRHHRLRHRPVARVLLRPRSAWSSLWRARSTRTPEIGRDRRRRRRRPASTSRSSGSPAATTQVELLEYQGCEQALGQHGRRADHGTGHFCVFVAGHRGALRRSRRAGRSLPLRRPGRDDRRRRTGAARASTRSIPTATSSSSTSARPMSLPDASAVAHDRPPDRPPLVEQYRRMLPDPALRGACGGALPAGRDRRHRAQLRRPGGDRRRRRGRRCARRTTSSGTTARTGT